MSRRNRRDGGPTRQCDPTKAQARLANVASGDAGATTVEMRRPLLPISTIPTRSIRICQL